MNGKVYTACTIITTLLTTAIVACVIQFLLPALGIDVPLWGFLLLMAAFSAYNFITYKAYKKIQDKEPLSPTQVMIGKKGQARTNLYPYGIIRVDGELWKARARCNIDKEEIVIVQGIEGLTLFVTRPSNNHQ